MAETVNIFGQKVPRNVVIVTGAVGAGVVGWAWFTRNRDDTDLGEEVTFSSEDTGFIPGASGGTQSGIIDVTPDIFENDSEWFNAAVEKLQLEFGVDDIGLVSDALTRYLANERLKANQVPMINFVINSMGPPPSGKRPIRQETSITPPPKPKPDTPGAIPTIRWQTGRPRTLISWDAASNAKTYQVQAIRRGKRGKPFGRINVGSRRNWRFFTLRTGEKWQFEVNAVNEAGRGPVKKTPIITIGRRGQSGRS